MAIADDFSIAVNGDIRYTGTTTNYTVFEMHDWLRGLQDDQGPANNDLTDITDPTASVRSTDNIIALNTPFNIDDTAAQHLYDGSISQANGDTLYSGLVVVGATETGTELQIVQNGALLTSFWSTGLNADAGAGILLRVLVKTRVDGADIDGKRILVTARELSDRYSEFSATLGLGNGTAAVFTSDDGNNQTASGTIATWTINKTEGYQLLDIAGDGGADEPFYIEYDHVTATGGTNTANDIYEWTKYVQRRGTAETIFGINGDLFRGPTHQITYDGATNGGPVELNYLAWGTTFNYNTELASGLTVGAFYTFGTSGAVGQLLALDDDGTTGFVVFDIEPGSGTVVNTETFVRSDGTATDGATVNSVPTTGNGGWALVLADDAVDDVWVQLIKGVAPVNNQIMYEATSAGVHDTATDGTATVNVTVTAFTIAPEFVGTSTGSAITGARGVGFDAPGDVTASDQFTTLTGGSVTPPNNVTYTINGLTATEDYILVGPEDGAGGLDYDQLTLNTSLLGATETAIVTTVAIPTDTPSSGTIRVQLDDGTYVYQAYTSFTGSTFTIASTDYSVATGNGGATQPRDIFISYLDKVATATNTFTYVYNADRTHFIRARDGGTAGDLEPIVPFETTGIMGTGGGSTTVIRNSDA